MGSFWCFYWWCIVLLNVVAKRRAVNLSSNEIFFELFWLVMQWRNWGNCCLRELTRLVLVPGCSLFIGSTWLNRSWNFLNLLIVLNTRVWLMNLTVLILLWRYIYWLSLLNVRHIHPVSRGCCKVKQINRNLCLWFHIHIFIWVSLLIILISSQSWVFVGVALSMIHVTIDIQRLMHQRHLDNWWTIIIMEHLAPTLRRVLILFEFSVLHIPIHLEVKKLLISIQ